MIEFRIIFGRNKDEDDGRRPLDPIEFPMPPEVSPYDAAIVTAAEACVRNAQRSSFAASSILVPSEDMQRLCDALNARWDAQHQAAGT